jgi:hypothetical protein
MHDGLDKPMTQKRTSLWGLNILADWVFAVFIAIAITAVYWNSLSGVFVWDDRAAVVSGLFCVCFLLWYLEDCMI